MDMKASGDIYITGSSNSSGGGSGSGSGPSACASWPTSVSRDNTYAYGQSLKREVIYASERITSAPFTTSSSPTEANKVAFAASVGLTHVKFEAWLLSP